MKMSQSLAWESGDEQLKEQIEKKVRAVVINMYGLREEQIEISFEGGK